MEGARTGIDNLSNPTAEPYFMRVGMGSTPALSAIAFHFFTFKI